MSSSDRIRIASPILDPKAKKKTYEQWLEIDEFITDDNLSKLTELTGLTRFEFFKRMRNSLYIDHLAKNISFVSNSGYFSTIYRTDLGRCHFVEVKENPYYPSRSFPKILDKDSNQVIYRLEGLEGYGAFITGILDTYYHNSRCDFQPVY